MIEVQFNNLTKQFVFPRREIQNILALTQKKLKNKKTQTVSLAFVSPAAIRKLNRIYRRKDKVTDVLSFGGEDRWPGESLLGEIIICPSRADLQAREFNHSFKKEVARLALHGYLHLLGFDHVKRVEAEKMERLEELIVAEI